MPRALRLILAVLLLAPACAKSRTRPPMPATSLAPATIEKASPERFHAVLRSLRGKPLVVNFWASWCGPCAGEMPRIVDAAKRFEGRIRFLGVDVEDARDSARAFAKKYGMPFASLADETGDIRRDQKILGLPVTHFYRSDGELAFRHASEIKQEDLDAKLRELLRVSAPAATP
jgi:thiol-disulfide isomerase/thioredoxin